MADWFLILITVISFLLLLVASLYFLVHYQHPDDRNEAWFPKLTVLLGMVLAGATVLLLPLDVANNEGYAGCDGYDTKFCGGLNMVLFWDIFYYAIPTFVFILIPFMTFFYEADDGLLMAGTAVGANAVRNSRFCEAFKYEAAIVLIFGTLFIVGYLLLSETDIPVSEYRGDITTVSFTTPNLGGQLFQTSSLAGMDTSDNDYMLRTTSTRTFESITIPVDVPTFFAGFMAFFGWFFFAIFGGIGLAAVPLDLILAFINRPKHMDPSEFADAQMTIRQRVNELVDIGEILKVERDQKVLNGGARKGLFSGLSKEARDERKTFLDFKKAVFLLDEDVEEFQACSAHYESFNPLLPWLSLFGGLLAFLLSVCWIVHIGIYLLPPTPIYPFLNTFFGLFDGWFPLLGVLSVAIFTLYLLLCAVKGCFKFGIRFMFFQIHPMKINKTYMSSFMFNVGLILLCALPVVQFCVTAFADYARYTTVSQVMGTQVQYLKFFTWFWTNNVFVYALVAMVALTTLYLFCRPRDSTGTNSIGLRDRLKRR